MSRRPAPSGGLPAGPSPRSRSRSRSRPQEFSRSDREQPLRSQKSFPRSRTTEPRRASPNGYESRQSEDSTSSLSSGSSSLFDRVKNSAAGYASSFTSIDNDDYEDEKASSLRNRRLARREKPSSPQDIPASTDTGTGDGYTIWSRVASAASTLTVSVSKAWTTNIATFAGEETPPGQESRLTRAMKAYHLEKARDPTDLPAWLFDEHERQPLQRTRQPQRPRREVEEQNSVTRVAEPPRPRGLRDVYDSVSRSDQQPNITPSGPPVGKGTDRLKALREAKRSAALEDPRAEPVSSRQRVGLPSGVRGQTKPSRQR